MLLVYGVQGGPRDPEPDLAHICLASLEAGMLRQVLRIEAFNQAAHASTAGPTRSCPPCPVPLENSQDPCRDLPLFEMLGGARIFVDQAAQDGFSDDPFAVEVGNDEMFTVGDAPGGARRRPGRVVVHLVFG